VRRLGPLAQDSLGNRSEASGQPSLVRHGFVSVTAFGANRQCRLMVAVANQQRLASSRQTDVELLTVRALPGLRVGRIAVADEDLQAARRDRDAEVVVAVEGPELRALEGRLCDEEDSATQVLAIAVRIRATDRELMAFVPCWHLA
jgi:hypothetical protein